jgi:hypothetical protein
MPKGKPARRSLAGLGDYQARGSDDDVIEIRDLFLRTIADEAPEVLDALATDATDDDIDAWADRFHIRAEWLVAAMRRTVRGWRLHPAVRRSGWQSGAVLAGALVSEAPVPAPVWLPTLETEQEFRLRVDAYILAVRTWAGAALAPVAVKRKLDRDLRAFVKRQCCAWDVAAIADEYFVVKSDDDTIAATVKALQRIGKLLDIPPMNLYRT